MIYLSLFGTFIKIGLLGFGGGLAIVTLIFDNIQQFGLITQEQFANMVAISQITPGPLATNVATFVGHEFAGIPGAIIATVGVSLPAFILISIVCRMLKKFNDSWVVKGALKGIRPATIGLIAAAVVTLTIPAIAGESRLGSTMFGSFGTWLSQIPVDLIAIIMTLATALLIVKTKKSPIIVLLIMGCIGALFGV